MKISTIILTTALSAVMTTNVLASNITDNTVTTETVASTAQEQQAQLTVTSAVARPAMEGSKHSAAYITLHNHSDKDITITSATSMNIANRVELHTVTDTNGVKKMVKVDKLVIPAGGDLVMQKGGIHIMLMNLKKLINIGDKFDIELHTTELGVQTVSVEVVSM
jgi:copper(I)-binding protein